MQATQTKKITIDEHLSFQTSTTKLMPFHLSMCANDLAASRHFYREIIGVNIGEQHEQFVMFVEDPSGNGIEIKSFTKVPTGTWT